MMGRSPVRWVLRRGFDTEEVICIFEKAVSVVMGDKADGRGLCLVVPACLSTINAQSLFFECCLHERTATFL